MSGMISCFRLPLRLRDAPVKNGEFTTTLPQSDPVSADTLLGLVECGYITCTRGQPGEAGATYAIGWIELDEPERYTPEVRERHALNMLRMVTPGGSA